MAGDLVVEPAQLKLLPRAHVRRRVADTVWAAVTDVRAAGHEGPEGGRVLGAASVPGGVVEVRQTEVVPEFMCEDSEATVLRLDRVVADPDASGIVRDGDAAAGPTRASIQANKWICRRRLELDVPAV